MLHRIISWLLTLVFIVHAIATVVLAVRDSEFILLPLALVALGLAALVAPKATKPSRPRSKRARMEAESLEALDRLDRELRLGKYRQ